MKKFVMNHYKGLTVAGSTAMAVGTFYILPVLEAVIKRG